MATTANHKVGVVVPTGDTELRFVRNTWEELETAIHELQWEPELSKKEFRATFEERAMRWADEEIDVSGSSYDFLSELERAGFLRTIPWGATA